jgi:hypothetical protein
MDRAECYKRIAQFLAVIICLLLFLSNSLDNASDYFSGQTTLTENVEKLKFLTYPSLTFCNETGFKNIELNFKLSDYIKNTRNIQEIFKEPIPEVRTTHSQYFGLCFTFTVTPKTVVTLSEVFLKHFKHNNENTSPGVYAGIIWGIYVYMG